MQGTLRDLYGKDTYTNKKLLLVEGGYILLKCKTNASQAALVVKNMLANAENAREMGSIPDLERSPVAQNENSFQHFFSWKVPWTEQPFRVQFMRPQRVGHG